MMLYSCVCVDVILPCSFLAGTWCYLSFFLGVLIVSSHFLCWLLCCCLGVCVPCCVTFRLSYFLTYLLAVVLPTLVVPYF